MAVCGVHVWFFFFFLYVKYMLAGKNVYAHVCSCVFLSDNEVCPLLMARRGSADAFTACRNLNTTWKGGEGRCRSVFFPCSVLLSTPSRAPPPTATYFCLVLHRLLTRSGDGPPVGAPPENI